MQQTSVLSREEVQRFVRLARYWDMVANSGRFMRARTLLLEGTGALQVAAFDAFLNFSDWLWATTGKTHEFAQEKLVDLLHHYLTETRGMGSAQVQAALLADYLASGARGGPQCLTATLLGQAPAKAAKHLAQRQARHDAAKGDALKIEA